MPKSIESFANKLQEQAGFLPEDATFETLEKLDQELSPYVIKSVQDQCPAKDILYDQWHINGRHSIDIPLKSIRAVACDAKNKRYIFAQADTAITEKVTIFPNECALAHKASVTAVAFSADGQQIITASDNVVYGWDTYTGKQLYHTKRYPKVITEVTLRHDKKEMAFVADHLYLWNIPAHKEDYYVTTNKDEMIKACALHPDGKRYVLIVETNIEDKRENRKIDMRLCHKDQDESLWAIVCKTKVRSDDVFTVIFNNQGSQIAIGAEYDLIVIFDTQTGSPIRKLSHNGPYIAFEPDDHRIVGVGRISRLLVSFPLDVDFLKKDYESLPLTQLYALLLCKDIKKKQNFKDLFKQNPTFLSYANKLPLEIKKVMNLEGTGVSMKDVAEDETSASMFYALYSLSSWLSPWSSCSGYKK